MAGRFKDATANAKAALSLARAIAAKLHDKGVFTDDDLEDVRRWALEDLDSPGRIISDEAARELIRDAFL